MSKGGSNKSSSSSSATPAEQTGKPVYPNLPDALTFDAYMPGQQEAIANQIHQGYGVVPEEMQTHMDQTTADMSIPRLYEPLTVTQDALKSGDWNMPDENYTSGSFALDALLGLPSAQPSAFTPGGVPSSVSPIRNNVNNSNPNSGLPDYGGLGTTLNEGRYGSWSR